MVLFKSAMCAHYLYPAQEALLVLELYDREGEGGCSSSAVQVQVLPAGLIVWGISDHASTCTSTVQPIVSHGDCIIGLIFDVLLDIKYLFDPRFWRFFN